MIGAGRVYTTSKIAVEFLQKNIKGKIVLDIQSVRLCMHFLKVA